MLSTELFYTCWYPVSHCIHVQRMKFIVVNVRMAMMNTSTNYMKQIEVMILFNQSLIC